MESVQSILFLSLGFVAVTYAAVEFHRDERPGTSSWPVGDTTCCVAMHLVLAAPTTMKAVWYSSSTSENTSIPVCKYGPSQTQLDQTVSGRSYSYTAGGFLGSLHEANMTNLTASSTYFYQCSTDNNGSFSAVSHFTVQPSGLPSNGSATIIGFIADMGIVNSAETVASLQAATVAKNMQLLIHAGDISYADSHKPSDNNSFVWLEFMTNMENITSRLPYMSCPGNHEAQFDFAAYLNWLPMPHAGRVSPTTFWHSFDYAGVHFTMFSTEHNFSIGSAQHSWIVDDLQQANANRQQVPWVIVVGHRPLYCSSIFETSRCEVEAPAYRSQLEDVLNQYGVDVYINGHNHQYERTFPVYHEKAIQHNYLDPKAPVYIVNGAAGNIHPNDPSYLPSALVPWRAAHGTGFETSWLQLHVYNATVLTFESILSSNSSVLDSFSIRRSTPP